MIGTKVAIIKDQNKRLIEMNFGNNSIGNKKPTKMLFEKSGAGNKRNPPINPTIIDMYAVFSFNCLL